MAEFISVEHVLEQAQQLTEAEQAELLVKLSAVVESHKVKQSQPRVAGLHRGMIWMSEDFDDYLGDDFWFGTEAP